MADAYAFSMRRTLLTGPEADDLRSALSASAEAREARRAAADADILAAACSGDVEAIRAAVARAEWTGPVPDAVTAAVRDFIRRTLARERQALAFGCGPVGELPPADPYEYEPTVYPESAAPALWRAYLARRAGVAGG